MRYIKRVLDISHDLERKSQFLFGPRQTGKTSWIREELDGVSYRFNLLDKKLVKALQNDPALFAGMLRREGIDSGLVVVDEIQKLPFLSKLSTTFTKPQSIWNVTKLFTGEKIEHFFWAMLKT